MEGQGTSVAGDDSKQDASSAEAGDAEFEMLEMLCDAAEADDYKESKKKELKLMNQIMDERQQKRTVRQETQKIVTVNKEVDNCVEEYS